MRPTLLALLVAFTLVTPGLADGPVWLTDLAQAQVQAQATDRLVLVNFTGSDFCSSCIRLHKEVFPAKAFTDYAQKRLVLMVADFPIKAKQSPALKAANAALAKRFKVDGYPTLLLLTSDGKNLGEVEVDLVEPNAKDLVTAIEQLARKAK